MGFLCGHAARATSFLKTGDRDTLAIVRAGSVKVGDAAFVRLIPLRGSGLSFGCLLEAGPLNASPGREFVCGDAGDRMADTIRRWAETAHGEKLNCERRETASG